jgi:hypothetical protein
MHMGDAVNLTPSSFKHTRQLTPSSQPDYGSHSKTSLNSELSGFDSQANVKIHAMALGYFDHVEWSTIVPITCSSIYSGFLSAAEAR